MKAKTRVRIIFFCLTISAIGLPLILISTPSIHQHFEPENIAISFVENLSNANFQEAKKLSTPESAETLYLFETLVGNQSDELKNTPTHFNISYSEMNTSQDTLFVQGKLFFSHKHKLIRKINLTLVNRRGNWLVDCFAEWCGPCKMMKPVLEELKKKMGNKIIILKIDIDKNISLSSEYRIQSVPTLVLWKQGEIIWRQSGALSLNELEQILSSYIR